MAVLPAMVIPAEGCVTISLGWFNTCNANSHLQKSNKTVLQLAPVNTKDENKPDKSDKSASNIILFVLF